MALQDYLIKNGDEKALTNAIIALLSDKELAEKMGKAGRKRVVGRIGYKSNCSQILTNFEKFRHNELIKLYGLWMELP